MKPLGSNRQGHGRSYNGSMLTLTYAYKLKPTQQQVEQLDHSLKICRQVWNDDLRERKDWIA